MQPARHPQTAEKKQQEGPESMPMLQQNAEYQRTCHIDFGTERERTASEKRGEWISKTAREGRLAAIWRWVASARTY